MIKSLVYASFYTILIISLRKITSNQVTGSKDIQWHVIKWKYHAISLPSLSLETT